MGTTKKYWKGLDELNDNPEFIRSRDKEFKEEIPVDEFLGDASLGDTSTSRRDFLKYMGFSIAAASLAACETPVTKTIPYVIKPEDVTPGISNWYASSYYDGNDYCSVLVKTRDGRPIKIEGNKKSPVTVGGANARVQASVLSLYDMSRARGPYAAKSASTWAKVDGEISDKLAAIDAKQGNITLLTSSIISPSTKAVIADFIKKYPTTKHIIHDAVSYSALIEANLNTFGKAVIPAYKFDKANVIVGVGVDFLANWLSPIEFAYQYAQTRKVSKEKPRMSKHIHFESILSLAGSNADHRVQVKPSQHGLVVANLYNEVAKLAGASTISAASLPVNKQIKATAKELWNNKGKSLVVCGSNDTAVQIVVNEINKLLNSYGNTIDTDNPCYLRQGNDQEFTQLVSDMKSGKVDALITYNVNPVYTAPASLDFENAYKKVGLKISFAEKLDETGSLADYLCPDHHYLESWNDFNPYSGQYSLAQPAISPLFAKPRYEGTRQAQESLLKWSGNNTDYHTYLQNFWKENIFSLQKKETWFKGFWNTTLRAGVISLPQMDAANKASDKTNDVAANKMDLNAAAQSIAANSKGGEWEMALYQKIGLAHGNQANNPWLQELPDPISRVTWDNYITMNPADMVDSKFNFSLMQEDNHLGEDNHTASMAKVTVDGKTFEIPVLPQPGQMRGTIGLAVGYGRTKAGRVGDNVGINAFPFVAMANGTRQYHVSGVQIASANKTYKIAATQTHHTMIGRTIVKEATLDEYKKDPAAGNEKEKIQSVEGPLTPEKANLWGDFDKQEQVNLYDNIDNLGIHWNLSIDLNSCIGCGACVVSCIAENNIPIVGKKEVIRSREMHWLRIDRYYSSDMTKEKAKKEGIGASSEVYDMMIPSAENPSVVFQPVLCQQCDHAPCETVCPVMATNHSSEGINQMIYNRCVGTRYCENNCPYKVRRFNWFNFAGNPWFKDSNPAQNELGRMVLNPDVVVRSRGVMEKCSLCAQRLQAGKLKAKIEKRTIKDGEIETACAQSCPTNAITFGNGNDKKSAVAGLKKDERMYHLLEELDVQPNVFYLTKIRNKSKIIQE